MAVPKALTMGALFLTALAAISCVSSNSNQFDSSFYTTPSKFPTDAPGSVVRFETMAAPVVDSQAWRVMYTSTGVESEPIVVSGMVFSPTGPAPEGGRPIVTWAHPTTGIEDPCAPSRSSRPYDDVQGLTEFLAKGWVVVASDYQGLGTDGPHPYLVGSSEAHATIDIVRAATHLDGVSASSNYMVFGHSQGGQAALFVGQIANDYAPDLRLLGVAAAAPAGELASLFNADRDNASGVVLGSYAVQSWAEVFGYDPSTVVNSFASKRVERVAKRCVVGASKASDIELGIDDVILRGRMWSADPSSTPPWQEQFTINTPGQVSIPVPVLITQGTADKIIAPATTAELVTTYTSQGTNASEQLLPGVDHMNAGKESVPYVVSFFSSLVK